jgi:hypothetical protein
MPPAKPVDSNDQSVNLFNGCVQGKGYSVGWSLSDLLGENNPKSLSELFDLILSVSGQLTEEFTGPIAFNSLDILSAPLLGEDPDKAQLQKSVADFFSSIKEKELQLSLSIDVVPPADLISELSKFQPSIDIFNEVFSDELGKIYGQGCFEPSIILNLHSEDVWTHPIIDKYLALSYGYGHPIIQNMTTSTIAHESTRPIDRVKDIDISLQRMGGPTGNADRTGILGYIIVNLAKMGYEASSEDNFFTVLNMEIDEASRILEEHRSDYNSQIIDADWLFSSIVLTGMNEGLEYLIDAPLGHIAGKAVTYKVMEFLRNKIEKIQYETNTLYTLESFPTESHNDAIIEFSELSNHYLTRGTELPHHHGDDLWDALEHQKKLQVLYTGASLVEIHVKDGLQYHDGCKLLTRRIIDQFGFSYLAVTPSIIQLSNGADMKVMRVDGVIHDLDTLSNNYKEVHEKRVYHDVKNK